jgi:hypothetical protein
VSARRAVLALLLVLAAALWVPASSGTYAQARAPGVEFVGALQQAYDALGGAGVAPRDDPRVQRARTFVQHAGSLAAADSPALAQIVNDLDHDPTDVADARTRLRTLLDALALPPNSVAGDPNAAQNALHDVYKQDAFSNLGATPSNDSFFSRAGSAILNGLRWIASHTIGTLGLVPTLLIAALVAAVIGFFIARRLQDAGTRAARAALDHAEPAPRSIDADAEWRLAEDAAARGEHREAVRHGFRSALLAAAQRGRLQVDAAWTTSELLARARGDADLLTALAPAAASFDQAWYSGRPVTEQDWEVARERCEAVRHLAVRRGVTA